MVGFMDDRHNWNDFKIERYPRRSDTYLATKLGPQHRCYFGGSGRCACGKHREPATVSSMHFSPVSTSKEHLEFDL